MSVALIKKMKNSFGFDRHELKNLADKSRENMDGITIVSEEDKKNIIFTTTNGVDVDKMAKYLCETLGDDHETPVKLSIYPLMLQQLCHNNSIEFANKFDMDICVGFNITACDCGDFMSFEVHSIPVDKDGKYYDITEDFFGEKEKWFLPLCRVSRNGNSFKNLPKRLQMAIMGNGGYCYSQREHTCNKAKDIKGKSKMYAPPPQIKDKVYKKKDVIDMMRNYKILIKTPMVVFC